MFFGVETNTLAHYVTSLGMGPGFIKIESHTRDASGGFRSCVVAGETQWSSVRSESHAIASVVTIP